MPQAARREGSQACLPACLPAAPSSGQRAGRASGPDCGGPAGLLRGERLAEPDLGLHVAAGRGSERAREQLGRPLGARKVRGGRPARVARSPARPPAGPRRSAGGGSLCSLPNRRPSRPLAGYVAGRRPGEKISPADRQTSGSGSRRADRTRAWAGPGRARCSCERGCPPLEGRQAGRRPDGGSGRGPQASGQGEGTRKPLHRRGGGGLTPQAQVRTTENEQL